MPSYSGHRFFLTLVDDCTRFTWVFLLKNKSDAISVVPRFFHFVANQFGKAIKAFRSDNAPELEFIEFFHVKEVLHQFSCVERPQQNSVVERKHQHLLNVARALYFQSQLSLSFWSDCILTATYLINSLPSPILGHNTPYELLYNQKVDYSNFRVFGCLAFASTLQAHKTKFHPRAKMCVFLGYPTGIKGYKLYDIQDKQCFVSRDVVFHEEIFPFQSFSHPTHLTDPFPDIVSPYPQADMLPASFPLLNNSTTIPPTLPLDSPPIPELTRPRNNSTIHFNSTTQVRKSTRSTKLPSYLKDYHCHMALGSVFSSSHPYSISKHLSYDSLPPAHKHFVLSVSSHFEPQFYHQAIKFLEWRVALAEELSAMEANHTWPVVPLPPHKHSIGCK